MSKRYGEPIEVEAPEGSVEGFCWRGMRYVVDEVWCRWRETGEWWTSTEDGTPWQRAATLEILRLGARPVGGAARGRLAGVYEIAHDLSSGRWTLYRVWD